MKNFLWAFFLGNFSVKFPCFLRASGKRSSPGGRPKARPQCPRHPPTAPNAHTRPHEQTHQANGTDSSQPSRQHRNSSTRRKQAQPIRAGKSWVFPQVAADPAGKAGTASYTHTRPHASRPAQRQRRHTGSTQRHRHRHQTHTQAGRQGRPHPTPCTHSTHHSTHSQTQATTNQTKRPRFHQTRPRPHHAHAPPAGDLNAPARRYWRASFGACGFGSPKF